MTVCFPCFGRSNSADRDEREPLLPKHRTQQANQPRELLLVKEEQTRSVVDKIVDVFAALNAGKIPTQEQLSHFLSYLLKTTLLKEDKGKLVPGNGPMSREGRKTLADFRGLVQAFLQFGMEKNADDIFQHLYFQLMEIDGRMMEKGVEVATEAAQRAVDVMEEGAGHVEDLTSMRDEIAFDAVTIIQSIRAICETCLRSNTFRLILDDIFSIARDMVAHAASDVERAARQVQQAADDVQHQAQANDDIIDRVTSDSMDEIKNKGKETADKITGTVKEAANELKTDLHDLSNEASDQTKEKLLRRIQNVFSRVQKDPASRKALHAILFLAQKYSDKIAAVAEHSEEAFTDACDRVKGNTPNHPPQPYSPTKEKIFFDKTSDAFLQTLKEVLQRLGQGYSLDGLISSFGRVVYDLDTIPIIFGEEVEKTLHENAPQSPVVSEPPSPLIVQQPGQLAASKKGKGKKNKKARMREKRAAEKATKPSPSVSASQLSASASEQDTHRDSKKNHLRLYFARLGGHMKKAVDEPGWAMSDDGAQVLETLFDDGVELLNIVGETVINIGEELAEPEDSMNPNPSISANESAEDKSQRQIKADLKNFMDELEAYISSITNDKTTMAVFHGLDTLKDDFSTLFFEGTKQGRRSLPHTLAGLRSWSAWVGWAILHFLHMLPSDAIPVPVIEIKKGNIEAALHGLFVQGLAKGRSDSLGASLVPDEVVLKEWTEVRIDMADQEQTFGSSAGIGKPGIQSTSRVRIHIDGIRAKVEDMGYYFKYTGDLISYADEGLLSIDVGIGGLHEGLAADVEIEIESDNVPFGPSYKIPEIVVVNEDDEALEAEGQNSSASGQTELLFRVVDVSVVIRDLKFKIDKSKHWILNKLLLQHLAGPLVANMTRQALEERVRTGLEVLSQGLATIVRDAKEKGELRRSTQRAGITLQNELGHTVLAESELEDGMVEILGDWWKAILNSGPAIFGRESSTDYDEGHEHIEVDHHTNSMPTSRGIIHTDRTTVVKQPHGVPAMLYNPRTREMEEVDLPVQAIGGTPGIVYEEETVIAVGDGPQLFPGKGGAYGATEHGDSRGVVGKVADAGKKAVDGTVEGLREGSQGITGIEEQWQQKLNAEKRHAKTWKSKAFDFR